MSKPFVERDLQLQQLMDRLSLAVEGTTQIAFIVGEAGAGKSTLVEAFARQAQQAHAKLLVVVGECNDITEGRVVQPYHPFRQILSLLGGDEERSLPVIDLGETNTKRLRSAFRTTGRALVELAPELVGTFIPGAAIVVALSRLIARERGLLEGLEERAEQARAKSPTIEDDQVCIQTTALLRAVARDFPLVLLLDDLHWVDNASVGLLFHLIRELRDSRLFVIGAYRPNEIVPFPSGEPHPLEKLRAEVGRYHDVLTINLDQDARSTGHRFVDALVDTEPNRLSPAFRKALLERTEANPLFTVELLRDMQRTGDLLQDPDGAWIESPALDWNELPERVERVIEGRVKALARELLEILEVASIEGKDFTAQVIALVGEMKERRLIQKLSEDLSRRHQLVNHVGEHRVGDTFLSRYTFAHSLYQYYLYQRLSPAERRLYHHEVADALEKLFADDLDQIVTQLAYHYKEGGQRDKAATYLLRAGEQALNLSASREAKDLLVQARLLLDGADKPAQRSTLAWVHHHLGRVYRRMPELTEAQGHQNLALSLARELGEDRLRVRVLLELALLARLNRDYEAQKRDLDEALPLAREIGDRASEARAIRRRAQYAKEMEDRSVALHYYRQSLALAREVNDPREITECLNSLAINYAGMGLRAEAVACYEEAIQLARTNKLNYQLRTYLFNYAAHYQHVGDIDRAFTCLYEALELARQLDIRGGQARTLALLGTMTLNLNRPKDAAPYILEAEELTRDPNTRTTEAYVVVCRALARLYLASGDLDRALKYIRDAIVASRTPFLAHALEGIILARLGDHQGAQEAWTHSLAHGNAFRKRLTGNIASLYYTGLASLGLALLSDDPGEASCGLRSAREAYDAGIHSDSIGIGYMAFHLNLLDQLAFLDRDGFLDESRTLLLEAIKRGTEAQGG